MPDYASILRRSISGLADPSPEMREAVYQRARAALARQLTAVDPPLSTREIEAQHQELEDAVARLEAEFAPPAPVAAGFGDDGAEGRLPLFAAARETSPERRPVAPPPQPAPTSARRRRAGLRRGRRRDFEDDEERGSRLPLLIAVLGRRARARRGGRLCLRGARHAVRRRARAPRGRSASRRESAPVGVVTAAAGGAMPNEKRPTV